MKEIDLYWFSGTGNTKLVVDTFKKECEECGVKVNLYKLEKTNPNEVDTSKIIGLAFPVAVQGTFPFIWNFIKNLPHTTQTEIFMIDTLGAFSGGIVGPVKKIVQQKGYKPIGAIEIIMPSNFFKKKVNIEKNKRRIEKSLKKVKEFAQKLIAGKTKWYRIPIFSDILAKISQSEKIWDFFRKIFRFEYDYSKCTKCGICVQLCPIGNIVWNEKGFPQYNNKCELCMRCYTFCPSDAIFVPNRKVEKYKVVDVKNLL